MCDGSHSPSHARSPSPIPIPPEPTLVAFALRITNSRRRELISFDELGTTQKRKRIKLLHEGVALLHTELRIDPTDIPLQRIDPHTTLALSTHERNSFRKVAPGYLSSEWKHSEIKKELTLTHATRTLITHFTLDNGTRVGVAYLADPLRFLSHHTSHSSYIAIGGDKGGSHTKIGVTFTNASNNEQ